jgi:hypothetical protein
METKFYEISYNIAKYHQTAQNMKKAFEILEIVKETSLLLILVSINNDMISISQFGYEILPLNQEIIRIHPTASSGSCSMLSEQHKSLQFSNSEGKSLD